MCNKILEHAFLLIKSNQINSITSSVVFKIHPSQLSNFMEQLSIGGWVFADSNCLDFRNVEEINLLVKFLVLIVNEIP